MSKKCSKFNKKCAREQKMFIKASVVHYGIELPCMALCGLVWPCTALYGLVRPVLPYMATYGLGWS